MKMPEEVFAAFAHFAAIVLFSLIIIPSGHGISLLGPTIISHPFHIASISGGVGISIGWLFMLPSSNALRVGIRLLSYGFMAMSCIIVASSSNAPAIAFAASLPCLAAMVLSLVIDRGRASDA